MRQGVLQDLMVSPRPTRAPAHLHAGKGSGDARHTVSCPVRPPSRAAAAVTRSARRRAGTGGRRPIIVGDAPFGIASRRRNSNGACRFWVRASDGVDRSAPGVAGSCRSREPPHRNGPSWIGRTRRNENSSGRKMSTSSRTRSATRLELFFDLAIVLFVTRCTDLLPKDETWAGGLRFAAVLAVGWWAWASRPCTRTASTPTTRSSGCSR